MRTVPAGSTIRSGEAQARKTFSCLAAGVAMISARGASGFPEGVVPFSFNSVSLDPPILVWSAPAAVLEALSIRHGCACGVSILTEAQAGLLQPPTNGREMHWECGDLLGVPLVVGAAAGFEVVITRCLPQGKNMLCFAEVARFDYVPGALGALRFAGEAVDFSALF